MTLTAELRAFRALLALVRDGIPLLEGCQAVAQEPEFRFAGALKGKLAEGALLSDAVPGLPPALRPILRWGERSGRILEAMEHVALGWESPADPRLPFYYLGCALGSAPLADVLRDGAEVFEVDLDWKRFAAELGAGATFGAAAAGKLRILPKPLEAVLSRAEASGNLPELLMEVWAGAQKGLMPDGKGRGRAAILTQAFHAWSLLMTAGCPLEDALAALRPAFDLPDLAALRVNDFVPSLEGAFTPSIRALLKKAYECGNLARTLQRVAEDLHRGWLPVF